MPLESGLQSFLQADAQRVFGEAFNHLIEEAVGDESKRIPLRKAARLHVEEFLGVDLARGCAVGAAYLIGEDLKAGQGNRFRFCAEDKVAHFLVGVCPMRVRGYPDESCKDCFGFVVERVFLEQVARCVGRAVVLQRALVKFLRAVGHRGR